MTHCSVYNHYLSSFDFNFVISYTVFNSGIILSLTVFYTHQCCKLYSNISLSHMCVNYVLNKMNFISSFTPYSLKMLCSDIIKRKDSFYKAFIIFIF